MTSLRPPVLFGLAALLVTATLDQAVEFYLLKIFDIAAAQPVSVTPFLDIVLSWNLGVSYSMLAAREPLARAALFLFQLGLVGGLSLWLWRAQSRLVGVALGLVIGGALGNLIDRVTHGAVADFFYLHTTLPVGPLANYIFNVADVGITLGVALLVLDSLVGERSPAAEPSAGPPQ